MQTFLPYPNFYKSARCLDNKRLGKQRVEAWQIYLALTKPKYGWKNHPAVKQWQGYEERLLLYGAIMCEEWRSRGFRDSMLERFNAALKLLKAKKHKLNVPPWLGNKLYHRSHQLMLLRKDRVHYGKYFEATITEIAEASYVWPSKGA